MWVITTDPVWTRTPPSPTAGRSSAGPAEGMSSMANLVEAFQCWTGREWAAPADGAMLFPNDKSAGEYLAAHKTRM